ncbi:hypothetical protein JCM10213v2_005951 [Rhodosporidiobolus nylandii]
MYLKYVDPAFKRQPGDLPWEQQVSAFSAKTINSRMWGLAGYGIPTCTRPSFPDPDGPLALEGMLSLNQLAEKYKRTKELWKQKKFHKLLTPFYHADTAIAIVRSSFKGYKP